MKKLIKQSAIMRFLFVLIVSVLPFIAQAEAKVSTVPTVQELINIVILSLLGFIILILIFLLYLFRIFAQHVRPSSESTPAFAGIMKQLTDAVPVEQEASILTDHVYDDIRELDNNLPPWWKYMFYATIVFAGIYIWYYHFTDNAKLQVQEYEHEMVTAQKEIEEYMKTAANSIDESNVKLADAKGIANGKTIFATNCAACHGQAGEGGVGPNLTDEYWLHGGGVKNVFKTIKYGVPQKGMISWKAQLSPQNIQEVSSFILSLRGTNPPNGKAPQGDKSEEK